MRLACLAALLGLAGCSLDCPPAATPPASCVLVAESLGHDLMTVTPACGISGEDVDVSSQFTGASTVLHVDDQGRSPGVELPAGVQDMLVLTWGDGCRRSLCVFVTGAGPAMECPPGADNGGRPL